MWGLLCRPEPGWASCWACLTFQTRLLLTGRRWGSPNQPSPGPLQFLCPFPPPYTPRNTRVSRAELDLELVRPEIRVGRFPAAAPRPGACADWSSLPGDYEVSIKFNDEHIPDSPFVYRGPPSQMMLAVSLSPASRCVPGWRWG